MTDLISELGITHRLAEDDDLPFVYSTLLRSHFHGSTNTAYHRRHIYFYNHHRVLDRIFDDPTTACIMACFLDDPNTLLGYLLCNPVKELIHYLYVKGNWQGQGIGRTLLTANIQDPRHWQITHMTQDGAKVWGHYSKVSFNPYELWRAYGSAREERAG